MTPNRAERPPHRAVTPSLSLRHVPPDLDEEPAYPDDPLLGWTHKPEPPPGLRLADGPWPPARRTRVGPRV
ncbi:hypothetical protein [Caldinitratiruptor microaerophilus]|uniref:Uncharacterized protein n=1 Tax=Caldinitratiruptor microaerophilus TaxID=671077 RepID=A0AA35G7K6_9FIRM|nr:hypothetical protein [Caldinitratiruptor microaerophilus]BDG59990.1 hypothetical protein caldi_10800 [Caldinitratiruptor microaerophilus]